MSLNDPMPTFTIPLKLALVTCGLLGFSILQGCATQPAVPVRRYPASYAPVPNVYTVQSGDTISKIANRYGLDWREIGRNNQLGDDYLIFIGQRLQLRGPASPAMLQANRAVRPLPSYNQNRIVQRPLTVTNAMLAPNTYPYKPVNTPSAPSPIAPAYTTNPAPLNWQWPTSNPIEASFNPGAGVRGIRFSGQQGDPVRAAADGEVVYASNGLAEYGHLILIRHSNGYITAYAHNDRLNVTQGERVHAGQVIAAMGQSAASHVMLEFQIRANGKAVNPQTILGTR